MIEEFLKQIVKEKREQKVPDAVIRNYLKEYLQYVVLEIIYSHPKYKKLIFTGGSCLRICFSLPRLSEDLDLDFLIKDFSRFDIADLAKVLEKGLSLRLSENILEVKIQRDFRIYLKFSVLHRLGLAAENESDKLFLKVEISKNGSEEYGLEFSPVSRFSANFLVRRYDLPSLMSGKIAAVLQRVWFKGEKSEIDIKGRDFYDLFWYLQNRVYPNRKRLEKITGIKLKENLGKILRGKIEKTVTGQKLFYDLSPLLENGEFVADFTKNYREIIFPLLDQLS